jgi:outer membrane protein TolC
MKQLLSLFLIAFVLNAKAQETKTLSLKDALTYALENKADAKKSKLQVENSEYQIQEVRSRALPQITASGSLTYNPVLQLSVIDGSYFGYPDTTINAYFGQKWTSGAGISLSQTYLINRFLLV